MRQSFIALLVGIVMLVGYRLWTDRVSAQAIATPFTIGSTVRLTVHDFPSGITTITCKVSGVHDQFIGCEGDYRERPPRFVNLRYVQEITAAPER